MRLYPIPAGPRRGVYKEVLPGGRELRGCQKALGWNHGGGGHQRQLYVHQLHLCLQPEGLC